MALLERWVNLFQSSRSIERTRKLKWHFSVSKKEIVEVDSLSFLTSMLLWYLRVFLSSLFCVIIGFFGIAALDRITIGIKEFSTIRKDPDATALFVGGFLIFVGLVIHGTSQNPIFLSQTVLYTGFFNFQRFLIVIISMFVSLFFGWLFYYVFAKVEPKGIDLDNISKSPKSVGIFVFCYEVFMGLVINASLAIPL